MLTRAALLGPLSLLIGAHPAAAQQQVTEDQPKSQEIQAVERGFFIEADVGGNLMVTEIDGRTHGFGAHAGLYLGVDVLPILSILAGATAVLAPGSRDNALRGDLLYLTPMAQLQLAVLSTERDFLYGRAGIGFAFGLPDTVENNGASAEFGGNGLAFTGVVGYEHYTKLRHFSFGVTAGVFGATAPTFALGVSLVPTLKYTF